MVFGCHQSTKKQCNFNVWDKFNNFKIEQTEFLTGSVVFTYAFTVVCISLPNFFLHLFVWYYWFVCLFNDKNEIDVEQYIMYKYNFSPHFLCPFIHRIESSCIGYGRFVRKNWLRYKFNVQNIKRTTWARNRVLVQRYFQQITFYAKQLKSNNKLKKIKIA